jgi:plasmid stability protein
LRLHESDSIAIILDMPQILIRQLNSAVVRKLRAKAAAEGVSAEEEARRILRRSLVGDVPSMPLIDFLRTMPDVDDDSIFRRRKRKPRKIAL